MNEKLKFLPMAIGSVLAVLPCMAGAANGNIHTQSDLGISLDRRSGKVTITWKGHGVLKKASGLNGKYRPVHQGKAGHNVYVAVADEEQAMFAVEEKDNEKSLVSNAVGYVNLRVLPGLSLFATPLANNSNTLAAWFPAVPGGSQVYKYTGLGGFEVSTFETTGQNEDGSWTGFWSNPDLDLTIGTGYYLYNPSSETFTHTFVGGVLQGRLVNPLAAGVSTEGALVPQAGSINWIHQIPGEPGDEIRIHTNDPQLGQFYQSSIFSALSQSWEPDISLGVAQGFWIQKQNPQDWVRNFSLY